MWLYGSEDTPRWYPSRTQSVGKVPVGNGNAGLAGVVQPPSGNVGQNEGGKVCNENHGTVEKELAES